MLQRILFSNGFPFGLIMLVKLSPVLLKQNRPDRNEMYCVERRVDSTSGRVVP